MIIYNYPLIQCRGRSDRFYVIPIGDIHYGSVNCNVERLKGVVKYIKDNKNIYWLGMGDMIEAINYSDPRYDPKNNAKGESDLSNLVYTQLSEVSELLSPISERCIGILEGNHEEKVRLTHHLSSIDILCEMLWNKSGKKVVVKNLTSCAYVRLRFGRPRKGNGFINKVVDIWCHHGYSAGRTVGADINSLTRIGGDFEADIFLVGHSHKKICHIGERLYLTRNKGSSFLLAKKILYGITGCFYQTYKEGGTRSYAEKKCYPPTPIGVLKILIEPHKNSNWKVESPVHLHISE